jgi:hypothetical protein
MKNEQNTNKENISKQKEKFKKNMKMNGKIKKIQK